jgi:hypothetical protein
LCLVPPELSCHRKERLWPQRIDLGLSNADMLSSSVPVFLASRPCISNLTSSPAIADSSFLTQISTYLLILFLPVENHKFSPQHLRNELLAPQANTLPCKKCDTVYHTLERQQGCFNNTTSRLKSVQTITALSPALCHSLSYTRGHGTYRSMYHNLFPGIRLFFPPIASRTPFHL